MNDDTSTIWRFGGIDFDEASLMLTVDGRAVELEHRPREMLLLLLHHAGDVVTKDALFETLWPGRVVGEASLTKCASRLRQMLGDAEQTLIRTVHGVGYRLAVPVTVEVRPGSAAPLRAYVPVEGDGVPRRANWRLVERLGRGGFGDAWLARHAKTNEQRVFKFAEDGRELAALRREVTLFRLLKQGLGARDDIARVIDWDFEAAPYFIELDWSEGGNLSDWAASHGGAAEVPLSTRLDLIAQVADVLAAAHSLGVLHKDVKPSNVLIRTGSNGRPMVRLSDFGSGRLLDLARLADYGITRTDFAATGVADETTSGTMLYRAPEILAGKPQTVQADIYALGVMLYQFVIGDFSRPLSADWERDVPDDLLREDIAAAAAGDAGRRLADAGALASRLRALEARRAERAGEERARLALEHSQRLLDRARARRLPLMILAASLLIGFGVSTWLYVRASVAGAEAARQAARATAVTHFLTDDLLSAANPLLNADPNVRVKDLLASAGADLDRRFAAGTLDRAAIEEAIGGAYAGLLDNDHAVPLLSDAVAIRARLLGTAAPETQAVRLSLLKLAYRRLDLPLLGETGKAMIEAARSGQALDPDAEFRARFAIIYAACKGDQSTAPCLPPVTKLFEEARARLGAKADVTLEIESEVSFELGLDQRFDEAIRLGREAVAYTTERYGPSHILTAERQFKLAESLSDAGQTDEAIALFTTARAEFLAVSGRGNEMTARIDAQLGKAFSDAKRYDEAVQPLQHALDYHVATRGEEFVESVFNLNSLANVYSYLRRDDEAISLGTKAYALIVKLHGAADPDSFWFANNLATFYERAGNLPTAEHWFRVAYDGACQTMAQGDWAIGHFAFHLGAVLGHEGRIDEARALLRQAVSILDAALGPDHPRSRRAREALEALGPPPAAQR